MYPSYQYNNQHIAHRRLFRIVRAHTHTHTHTHHLKVTQWLPYNKYSRNIYCVNNEYMN